MLGVTWIPNTTNNASLEWMQGYVFCEPTRHPRPDASPTELLWAIEGPQLAFRSTHVFIDDRGTLNLLAILVGIYPFNGFAARVDLGIKLNDGFQVNLGYVGTAPRATRFGPFYSFGLNDRVLLSLRWSRCADCSCSSSVAFHSGARPVVSAVAHGASGAYWPSGGSGRGDRLG